MLPALTIGNTFSVGSWKSAEYGGVSFRLIVLAQRRLHILRFFDQQTDVPVGFGESLRKSI
jgi:hypothetical protein